MTRPHRDPGTGHAVLGWAAAPGPALLLAAARRRWEAGHRGDRVQLAVSLTAAERHDVGRLLGLSWEFSGRCATLGQLRAAIGRAEPGWDVPGLLTAVGGELHDQRTKREHVAAVRAARREQLIEILTAGGAAADVAELALARRWLGGLDDPAIVPRAESAAAVLTALPARDGQLLASLASELFADPHALDRTSLLGRAAARLLAGSQAVAAGEDPGTAIRTVATSAGWREAWQSAGIACDQVSSTVLVLNVPLPGPGVPAVLTRAAAQAGEPLWLTARMLRPGWALPPGSLPGLVVRVCENPSLVEAAAECHAAACLPLVCTYGRPSGAAWTLLRGLAVAGARIRVSGDRDEAGQAITQDLLTGLPRAEAWLPQVAGLYEEDRLTELLDDLRPA